MTEIYEYDGPTAWADMTAVEKMEGILIGEFTDVDELELYRQAIREAASEQACLAAMTAAHRESQAEVARLRAALVEVMEYEGGAESPLEDEYVVDRIRAALEPTR